jgi:hypothetical protein
MTATRSNWLHAMAIRAADSARRHAAAGDLARAMLHLTIANMLRYAATGDRLGVRLALQEARTLRQAIRARMMEAA